jgi:palmitoyltransferase
MKYYDQLNLNKRNELNQLNNNINDNLNNNIIKCEGCFENDAMIFCEECNKNYCQKCDDQLHVVPSFRNHIRNQLQLGNTIVNNSLNNSELLPSNLTSNKGCFLHNNEQIQYFCESCEEPICQKCQMIGPHNNKLHKIVSIAESFKKKFVYINKIANKQLVSKYKQMLQQLKYLENISNEIRRNKNSVEREIRTEYSKHFENLNSVCGKKFAVINFESNNLQKDLNCITELINYINDLTNSESPDMISFLIKFKQLNNMIENSLTKPINNKIEINMNDFPRDVEERQTMITVYEQLDKLSRYKDEIIWRILMDKNKKMLNREENKNNYDENDYKINEETKIEIQKWAKLSDKYASELQKYYLVCQFCGCILDETTVNTPCDKNSSVTVNNNGINANDEKLLMSFKPKDDIYGNKRHHFIKPKDSSNKFKINFPFDKNLFLDGNLSSDK